MGMIEEGYETLTKGVDGAKKAKQI